MQNVGWALVGTSGFAETEAARAVKATPGVTLVGALGSTKDTSLQFQRRHGCPRNYSELADVATDPEVSVVWVANPNYLHSQTTIDLLKAGKHVLVEKPMATSVRDAEAMVTAASGTSVILCVGYHHRFSLAHRHLRQMVSDGLLGKICFFRIHTFVHYPSLPPSWRRAASTSGGWAINDVGTHLIDLMLWISGLSAQVVGARLSAQRFPVETDDGAALLFALETKGIGIVDTSTALDSPSSLIEIYGDAGWARARGTLDGSGSVESSWQGSVTFDKTDRFVGQVSGMNDAIAGKPSINARGPLCVENVRLIQLARSIAK